MRHRRNCKLCHPFEGSLPASSNIRLHPPPTDNDHMGIAASLRILAQEPTSGPKLEVEVAVASQHSYVSYVFSFKHRNTLCRMDEMQTNPDGHAYHHDDSQSMPV